MAFLQGPTDCTGEIGNLGSAGNLLQRLDTVKVIRCDEVQWRFLGLSLAGYNVLISLLMAAIAAWGSSEQPDAEPHGEPRSNRRHPPAGVRNRWTMPGVVMVTNTKARQMMRRRRRSDRCAVSVPAPAWRPSRPRANATMTSANRTWVVSAITATKTAEMAMAMAKDPSAAWTWLSRVLVFIRANRLPISAPMPTSATPRTMRQTALDQSGAVQNA